MTDTTERYWRRCERINADTETPTREPLDEPAVAVDARGVVELSRGLADAVWEVRRRVVERETVADASPGEDR